MGTEITSLTTPYTNGIKAILQLRNDGYLTVLKTIDNGVTWGVVKDLTADTRFLRQDPVDEDIIELAENLNSQVFRSYFYYGYTGTGTPCNNAPTDSHGFMLVNKTSSDNIHITAFPTFGHGRFFTKTKVNGTWQEWMEHGTENRKQHKLLFKYFSTMTATATELDCNWEEYDYLIVYMCHYANVMAHTIVPYDYFKSTTSGTRPIIEYGDCSLQVWQNGFGSIIVKPNQNCIDTANYAIMIYGVSA